ncbi:CLUMA_CG014292, isoform C [Clunio marinus]|uniref:CLUMA_CG014292, isoform C n=1 Tax=Clunio marinus TaxID=568069 RepID=A0A1J1IMH5_9DIPT|nr:CLUMA_CG014292, isoform C [Clunio marinus]
MEGKPSTNGEGKSKLKLNRNHIKNIVKYIMMINECEMIKLILVFSDDTNQSYSYTKHQQVIRVVQKL